MSAGERGFPRLSDNIAGAAILAITGMQLMATLDGTIVIVALPRMQADLDLSDAAKSWVITAYVLAFGGLLLLGGRVGDAIGHKRAFISGVGVFTIASLVCGLANDQYTLIAARALQGVGAAVAAPTGLALIATTYAVGHARNQALAVSAAMQGLGSVLGLVLGGALTAFSWRLAFLVNVPIGIFIVVIAVTRLAETRHERLKLDITGALLATLGCTSAVLLFTQGPPRGWIDPWVIGAGIAAAGFFIAFLFVERTAQTRWCRSRCSTTATGWPRLLAYFLAGGVMLTLSVMIGLLVQDVLGYSPLRAGLLLHPVRDRLRLGQRGGNSAGTADSAALVDHRLRSAGAGGDALRVDLDRSVPYFPNLFMLIVLGGFGIGVVSVVLPLCTLAGVPPREIGPVSAVTLMVYNLGGPLMLVFIQAVQTSRTLYLGGTTGPVEGHDVSPAGCARTRLHLFAAVGGRCRGAGRDCGVVDRLLGARYRPRPAPPGKPWSAGELSPGEFSPGVARREPWSTLPQQPRRR